MKNILKILALAAIILIVVFIFISKSSNIEVSFENNSGETSAEFFLYFTNTTTPHSVPNIEPNNTYTTNLKYKDIKSTDMLKFYYYDYNNNKVDLILIDSFEKGHKTKILIDIIDTDEKGIYTIEIL